LQEYRPQVGYQLLQLHLGEVGFLLGSVQQHQLQVDQGW
jgi:hypothetical protein